MFIKNKLINPVNININPKIEQLKSWIVRDFQLPKSSRIEIIEHPEGKNTDLQTDIQIQFGKKNRLHLTFKKPVDSITDMDIREQCDKFEAPPFKKNPVFGHLFRFFGMWFAVSSIYAMSAVCPFCGQAGCVVGAGSVGVVGGFFALCTQNWKTIFRDLKSKVTKK